MSSVEALTGGLAGTGYEGLIALDQAILDALPAAIYVCAANGVITRYNRKASELWGRAPRPGDTDQRFCGAFRLRLLDGSILPHARTPMAAALRTGEPQLDHEVVIERPDNSEVVALVNIAPLKNRQGAVEGAVNCFIDITDRKNAERAARASQEELEDFFENAPAPMHIVGSDGIIQRANKAELDYLGYESEEYVGRKMADFYIDQDTANTVHTALEAGKSLAFTPARLRARDGSIRTVRISSSARWRDGAIVNTRCILHDASSEGARQQLAAIVDSSEDAIISKNLDSVIVSWNKAAERIFGYGADETIGSNIRMLFPEDRFNEEEDILGRIKKGERVSHFDTVRQRKDGALIDVSLTISPIKDALGRIVGASQIARDITDRKRAEIALREQTERLDAFNKVAKALASDLDLERVVQTVTDAATALTGAKYGAFFYNTTGDDGECYTLYALSGAPRAAFDGLGLPRITPIFQPTFRGEGIVRSDDIRKDSRYGRNSPHSGIPERHLPVVSYLAAPVISRSGEVIGGLFMAHDEAGVFTETSEEVIAGVAAHAALAIDNARLLISAQREIDHRRRAESSLARRVDEQAALYQFTDRLHRAGNRHDAYAAALDAIMRALCCARASILIHDEGDVMRFVAWRGLSDSYRAAVEGHSPWAAEAVDPQPVTIDDVAAADLSDEIRAVVEAEEISALAFIPVIVGGRLVGKFMAYYDQPHAFSDSDIDLALAIARQLGFTLHRMRAEEELRENEVRERARAAELEAIMESTPAVMFVARDPECRTIFGNPMAFDVLRVPGAANLSLTAPEDERPTNFEVHAGGRKLAPHELPVQRAARGEVIRNFEEEVRFKDGGSRYLLGNASPFWDAEGRPCGAVAAFVDITDRKRAEIALRESEQRLQMALEAGRMGAWEWDMQTGAVIWSPGLEIIHGLSEGEFGGTFEDFRRDIHPDDAEMVMQRIHRSCATFEDYRAVYRIRCSDGAERWIEAFGRVSPGSGGEAARMAGVCMDITERREAEAQRDLMVAELSHRVKNTLATVISIAQLSFSRAPSPEDARALFQARIRALAHTHGRLAESNWTGVSLEMIVLDELAPYRDGANVHVAGPQVALNAKSALMLGMALHELVTNAAKHGALSKQGGSVRVVWVIDSPENRLRVRWVESGGPAVIPPSRTGFGRMLLEEALVSDLAGDVRLDFDKDGFKCAISIPLDGSAGNRA